jgi:hypothetical protein
MDIRFEVARRSVEAAGGGYDFMWIGEDLGIRNSPIISMTVFRKHMIPFARRNAVG